MAFKDFITDPAFRSNFEFSHMWSIGTSVGWGNYNFWDDVMLVQYLINKCAGKKVLETDGVFGQKTYKAIKNFQQSVRKSVGPCRTDGRVSSKDRARVHTDNGEFYTIDILNWLFYSSKRIYFEDLRRDPDLPSELLYIGDY